MSDHPDHGHERTAGHRGARRGHSVAHGAAGTDVRYLAVALGLITAFMAGEVIVGVLASSLALLADAGHMLTDVAALAGSIVAARLAARPAVGRWTYGLKRAEILSAAVNGITLVAIAVLITAEAIGRLVAPTDVNGSAVLAVAMVGVVVNLVATMVLSRANRSSLNVEGSFRHIVTDLYAFIATAVAAVLIIITGFDQADAIASLFVVVLMAKAAWGLLGQAGHILLEAAPDDVDLDQVRRHLLAAPHVSDVHDLHVWTVTTGHPALSAHVVVDQSCFADGHAPQILDEVQSCVADHFDVDHSTFQLEPDTHAAHEFDAHR